MLVKIKCPKCRSDKLESFRHSGVRTSADPKLPNAKGSVTYECLNPKCRHEFSEDELNKNE